MSSNRASMRLRKLKLFFACLLMAVLSIGQVWGAPSMQAINGTTAAGSTTFSAANVASGTAGIVSWTSSNVSYSSNRVDFAANSSMTISVSSGYVITKVETNTATGSSDYYGSLTSTAGTKTVSNDKNYTFSGINAASVTLNNGSTAYRITSTGWIKVYYEESSGSNNPTISVDPEDATYGVGDVATALSVTAAPHTTGKTLSYKWYSNSSKSTDGATQVGTAATYTPSTAAVGTTYYYCVVSEQDGGSATSGFATIQVKAKHTVTWNNNGSTSTTQVVEGAKPTFPAKPASCATDCDKFYGWATEAWTGKLTDISGKTIHTSNATMDAVTAEGTVYYAVFTDVVATDYSTTYTSNVTLPSSGTNVSSATLVIGENDDIDAFKLGKSGAGATSSFTVPSGTTKIYLHAAAWNGKTVSLTLATDVGSISPDDAQDLTSNSGIANSSPFTLNTTGTGFDFDDLFFEYTLENVDDEAEITVTATGERAVIWGVNAVASASSGDAHYMTTCAACTHLVDAPELNGAVVVTHNSATINWKTLTNASSYDVTVIRNSDSESIFSGNVNALTKALTGLDPETQYDYSIMGVGDGSTYCTTGNGVLNGSFTTDAAPTAHLTLIDINGTHASSGDYVVGTPFNLPTTAATCAKTFVGWDANDECVTAPTYAKGASFTFANTTGVTLYAVYADMTGGSTSTTNIKCTVSTTTNMTGGNDADLLVDETDAADAGWVVTGYKGGGSNFPGLNKDGTIRLYYNASGNSYIDVTAPSTITSIAVTCKTGNNNIIVKVGENTIALAEDVYPINATSFRIINGYTESTQVHIQNIAVKFTNPGTPSNYSTTCIDAPTATPDENSIGIAAAGESSTLGVTYEHVNLAGVNVTLYNDVDCSVAFDGGWLTASVAGDDKHIAYTAQANTSYNDARTAYIKLTAPETSGAASPAVVVIPVTQAKKAAEFASLQELVAADVNANTEVTVSFSDVVIKEMYEYNDNVCGVVFNIQKAGEDIKIYFNSQTTISGWVAGGKLSGTLTNCPWKIFSSAWQLAPKSGWAWANLTYEAPAVVSNVAVSGTPNKTTYNTGEAFDPAGLTVTVTYSNTLVETITANDANWAYVSWSKDPATFAAEHVGTNKSVSVTATYNAVPSSATEISGLTINKIAVSGVSLNKNAATLKTGKTLTLTATITPENATYKTVSWKSDDTDIATVNEDGVVTAVAAGTTTITATSTDDNTKKATCELTVIESVNFNNGIWKLVTNKDELTAGSYVIFAAAGDDVAMKSYDTGNNCRGKSATKSDFLTYDSEFGVFEIGDYEISTVTYKTFQDENTNQYLFLSSNNNYLKAQDDKDETVAWTITNVSNEGVTVVTSKSQSTRTIRYNANTANPGNPLFACYTTGQADIALYKFYIEVTFEANGGSTVEPVYVEYNESVAAPANPTKAGYRFNGWKLNSAAYDFNSKLTENITLVADWSQLYTVTYAAGEGSGDAPDAVQKVAGEAFNLAANTFNAPAGKEFDGWLCDINAAKYAAGAEYTMTAAATTFTAQWKQITYAVTYVSAHGTAPDAENAASVTLVELTEAGWTHTGWVANVDVEVDDATVTAGTPIANGKVVVLSAATEFTAQWIEDAPTPTYETVRTGLTAGRHYTVCLEKNVTAVKGATFWSLTYKNEGGTIAYLEEETAPFAEGKPYIIQATDDNEGKLEVIYGTETAVSPVANGVLRGTFSYLSASQLNTINNEGENDVYMLFNNELRPIGTNNHLDAHRAYVLYNLLQEVPTAGFAPGKRVKGMPMQPQVTTDIDNVQGENVQCTKVLIDGQMYILRGEKLYDATGRLVK